ncbi:MAG TPA: NAD-dependent dehydratase [Elusimicrobia bacterium]|nr:NAD-dependent dehydratase [Elusimicrobiota bacterium]
MNWRAKKVLVTGAGGFIGSHLSEELANRGASVRALVHYNSLNRWGHLESLPKETLRRIRVVAGDVTDPACVREAVHGCDIVFHLAALIAIPYSYAAPSSYAQTNVLGTLNVLDACRLAKAAKLVHTSTSEVYGTARYTPIDEEHPLQGQSPYSASKIGADQLALSFHRSFGLPVAVIRPFNAFGPRQSARAVLPTILSQLLSGYEELSLGSLSPVRDFSYVSDTVAGFLAVAASPKSVGEVINIGSGRGITVGEAAQAAMRVVGRKARIRKETARLRPPRSEVLRLIASNAKARRLLGWKPSVRFEDGLRLTARHIAGHLDDYKAGLYNV